MTTVSPAKPRRSWPLVALAVTSFIPGFGFFLGAIAVSWGLLTDRPRARLTIGLGAAGALLQLAGAFTYYVINKDSPTMRAVQLESTRHDLASLARELDAWRVKHERYPGTLQELVGFPIPTRNINITDVSGGLLHPQPYHYRITTSGLGYTLFAVGPDGVADTPDDIHPPVPDSLADPESVELE